jgi:hypothetical protein
MLASSFKVIRSLQAETFMDLLALDAKHLGDFVAQQPSEVGMAIEGKLVVFGANPNNQQKPKKVKESLGFESMLPVLGLLSGP